MPKLGDTTHRVTCHVLIGLSLLSRRWNLSKGCRRYCKHPPHQYQISRYRLTPAIFNAGPRRAGTERDQVRVFHCAGCPDVVIFLEKFPNLRVFGSLGGYPLSQRIRRRKSVHVGIFRQLQSFVYDLAVGIWLHPYNHFLQNVGIHINPETLRLLDFGIANAEFFQSGHHIVVQPEFFAGKTFQRILARERQLIEISPASDAASFRSWPIETCTSWIACLAVI